MRLRCDVACGARFCAVLLALVVIGNADRVSGGSNPSSGDGSQTGDGSNAYTGLAQAPEANLFIGSATTAIPLIVPPGRRAITPALALSYASNAGPSPYGHGWDLPLPRVQRSTKHGAMLCRASWENEQAQNYNWVLDPDPMRDEFVVSLPGGVDRMYEECRRDLRAPCRGSVRPRQLRRAEQGLSRVGQERHAVHLR